MQRGGRQARGGGCRGGGSRGCGKCGQVGETAVASTPGAAQRYTRQDGGFSALVYTGTCFSAQLGPRVGVPGLKGLLCQSREGVRTSKQASELVHLFELLPVMDGLGGGGVRPLRRRQRRVRLAQRPPDLGQHHLVFRVACRHLAAGRGREGGSVRKAGMNIGRRARSATRWAEQTKGQGAEQ